MRDTVMAGLQAAMPADGLQSLRREGATFSEGEGFAHAGMA